MRLLRAAPSALRIVAVVMVLVAVAYAVSALPLLVRHSSSASVATGCWLVFFAVVNAALAVLLLRATGWARVVTLSLYTLSVVRDAAAFFDGSASLGNVMSLLVAALVIVLLGAPASVQRHFQHAKEGAPTEPDRAESASGREPHG